MRLVSTIFLLLLLVASVRAIVRLAPGHAPLSACITSADQAHAPPQQPLDKGPYVIRLARPWSVEPAAVYPGTTLAADAHGRAVDVLRGGLASWFADHECAVDPFGSDALLLACLDTVAGADLEQLIAIGNSHSLGFNGVCALASGNKHHASIRQADAASRWPAVASRFCLEAPLSHELPPTHRGRRHFESHLSDFAAGCELHTGPHGGPATVACCFDTAMAARDAAIRMAEHHLVHYVAPVHPARPLNKWVRGQLQSGVPAAEPFSASGLQGDGYIVGVADTGVDTDHCFFDDVDHALQFNQANPSHRKIYRYTSATGHGTQRNSDFLEGHGTHVVGTLVGSVTSAVAAASAAAANASRFHGVIPRARVSFTDLAANEESITLPSRVDHFIHVAHGDGARVHSNSWGVKHADYTSLAQQLDTYAASTPDMLMLFAAGNDADVNCDDARARNVLCDRYTVMSPSTSKNGLSVGASMAVTDSWVAAGHGNYLLRLDDPSVVPASSNGASPSWATAGTRAYRAEFGASAELAGTLVLDPSATHEGCSVPDTAVVGGRVVLVLRGTCKFGVKAQNLAAAGAAGMVVVNNIPGDPIIMGQDKDHPFHVRIPGYMIGQADGRELMALIAHAHHTPIAATVRSDDSPDAHKDPENLSSFSSHGPTRDLRYKPDLVAVGEFVHSARSDALPGSRNCDLWPSMGTSMSTPAVAGAAVLVREYFDRGFYPTGVATAANAVALRSDTLKAILVHASMPLQGLFDRNSRGDWRRLGSVPSFEQGHGSLRLNSTLRLVSSQSGSGSQPDLSSGPQLFVSQNLTVQTGERHVVCVAYRPSPSAGGDPALDPFRATLAWIDPAGNPSAHYQLVNDLDLHVEAPDGREFFGNRRDPGGVRATATDRLNNVERVIIRDAPAGMYRVTVNARHIPHGPQSFALATSGSAETPCASLCDDTRCAAHGACSTAGECTCHAGWRGTYCDIPVPSIGAETLFVGAVEPMEWEVISLHVPAAQVHVSMTLQSMSVDGDPNVYVGFNTHPQPFNRRYALALTQCDNCANHMGGPLPANHSLQFTSREKGTYYIAIAAMCCTRAPFRLYVKATEASTPSVHTVSLGATRASDLDWSRRVLNVPTDVAVVLNISGSFDKEADASTTVRVGAFQSLADTVECILQQVAASSVMCLLPAESVNRLCSASPANTVYSVAVTQAGSVFRTVGSRSTLTCYHVSQADFRAPNGETVHELDAAFAVPASAESACDRELLAMPLPDASTTIECLRHRLALLQSTAGGPAPLSPRNQTLVLPFGAASRGEVVALAVQDASSVLPPVQSHWWPMGPAVASLAVALVNPATNQWFACDHVTAAPGGLFFRIAPPGSVPPTNTLLKVVIGAHHANTTHVRWGQAPGLTLKIQAAPDGIRLSNTRDPEFRGPLPRLPEAALRLPLTLFVLGQDIGPRRGGVLISPAFSAAERYASPSLQPVFGASSEVKATNYTFDADGAGIQVDFPANAFACGVPMALHLQRNVSATLYGSADPDTPLAEASVSFHCPSKIVSVAAHVPHSYHAMPETAGSRIEVFGAFADYPTAAVLRDPATAVELPLSVLHWSTSAITLTLPSAQRPLLVYNTPLDVIVVLPNGRNVSTVSPFATDGPVLPVTATFYMPNTTAAITGIVAVSPQPGSGDGDTSAVTLATVVAESAFSPARVRISGMGLTAEWARSSQATESAGRVLRFTNRSTAAAEFLHGKLNCVTSAGVTSASVADEFHAPVTDVNADGSVTVAVHPSAAGTCHVSLHIAASRQPQPTYRLAPAADALASDSVTLRRSPSEIGAAGSLRTPGAAIGAVLIAGRQSAVALAMNPELVRVYPNLDARVFMAAGRHTWPGTHSVCASASSDALLASSAWPSVQIGTTAGTITVDGSSVLEHVARTAVASGWAADESAALVDMPVGLVGCVSPTSPASASLLPLATPAVRVVVLRRLSVTAPGDVRTSLSAQELLGTDDGATLPRLSFKGAAAAVTLSVNTPLSFGVDAVTQPGMRFSAHAWIVQSSETSLTSATAACRAAVSDAQSVHIGAAIAGDDGSIVLGSVTVGASPLAGGAPALLCITVGVTAAEVGLPPASQASSVPLAQLVAVGCSDDDECGTGVCDRVAQQCRCDARTRGPNCEFACPVRDSDSAVCHGRGECGATGSCTCFPGFAGPSCAASVESLGVTYLKPVSGAEITLQLPALKDSPDAAAASWRLLQIVDGTDGPRGDKDLEVSVRVGALQRLIKDSRAAPANVPVWLDAYQWCSAADVGVAGRALRHYEAPPQGLLPGAAAQMSFVLGRAEFVNCSCHIPTKTDPLAGHGAAVTAPRHFCLGLYLSSRGVVQEPVTYAATVAEPLQVPVAITVKHQDHEVIEPDIVVRACGTPCLTIRAALAIAFALLGVLVAHLLTKRC